MGDRPGFVLAVTGGEGADVHVLICGREVLGLRRAALLVWGVIANGDHLHWVGELVAVVPRVDLLRQGNRN